MHCSDLRCWRHISSPPQPFWIGNSFLPLFFCLIGGETISYSKSRERHQGVKQDFFYIKLVSPDSKPRNCTIRVNTFEFVKKPKNLRLKKGKKHTPPQKKQIPPETNKSKHTLQTEGTICQIMYLRANFLIYKEPFQIRKR